MTTIVLDGLNEEDFRRSIENRLREARPGAAIGRLRTLLAPYAGPGGLLPERFLTVASADLVLTGWNALAGAVSRHDQPGRPVTAVSISFAWPGDDGQSPDAQGRLRPYLEVSYFSDNAFPFSQSGREDLLEGYSYYGCNWSGNSEASDTALSLEGIDDLHGALALLEARLLVDEVPDEEAIRAGSLGACLLSALLIQAVTDRIARDGLPRPLCVMAGSSGVYPYFDAPVAGIPEEIRKAAEAQEEDVVEAEFGAPAPRYSSLMMTGIPRAKKRAVLVLEECENAQTNRIARLRGINHSDSEDPAEPLEVTPAAPLPALPDPPAIAASDSPLLAKKPAKQARDLYELLGLPEPDSPRDGTPPREAVDWPEPVEPPLRSEPPRRDPPHSEPPVGPGFTLLDADQQQRLQSLLAPTVPPIAETPKPLPPIPAEELEAYWPGGPDWRDDSIVPLPQEPVPAAPIAQITPPAATGLVARLRDRLRSANAWLGKFRR